jgi:hypothetical protein
LLLLGFEKKRGIGRGKHPEKYLHPTRQNLVEGDKPFILVTHEYFDANGQRLMKRLQHWGFTKNELELACQGQAPKEPSTIEEPAVASEINEASQEV